MRQESGQYELIHFNAARIRTIRAHSLQCGKNQDNTSSFTSMRQESGQYELIHFKCRRAHEILTSNCMWSILRESDEVPITECCKTYLVASQSSPPEIVLRASVPVFAFSGSDWRLGSPYYFSHQLEGKGMTTSSVFFVCLNIFCLSPNRQNRAGEGEAPSVC